MALPRRQSYGGGLDIGALFGALYDAGVFGETEESKRAKERIGVTGEEQRKTAGQAQGFKMGEENRKYQGIGEAGKSAGAFGFDTMNIEELIRRGRELEALYGSKGLQEGLRRYVPESDVAADEARLRNRVVKNPAYEHAFTEDMIFGAGNKNKLEVGPGQNVYTGLNQFTGTGARERVVPQFFTPPGGQPIQVGNETIKETVPGSVTPRSRLSQAELEEASMQIAPKPSRPTSYTATREGDLGVSAPVGPFAVPPDAGFNVPQMGGGIPVNMGQPVQQVPMMGENLPQFTPQQLKQLLEFLRFGRPR